MNVNYKTDIMATHAKVKCYMYMINKKFRKKNAAIRPTDSLIFRGLLVGGKNTELVNWLLRM